MTGTGTVLSLRPRRRSDLLVSRELYRGPAPVFLLRDRRSGKAYEISPKEEFVVRRLDGQRSLEQIGEEYAQRFRRRLNEDHWTRLLWLLHHRDLLEPPEGAEQSAADEAGASGRGAGAARHPALDRWVRALAWCANRPAFAALVLVALSVQALVVWNLPELWQATSQLPDSPWLVAPVSVLVWLSAAAHEFAHGLVARYFGCTIKRMNLLLLQCAIEDYLYLRSRSAQVLIAAAGGLANGLVLVPVAVTWLVLPPNSDVATVAAGYLLIGSVQAWVNFLPLPPLDGYKICSHTLGMLDLARESRVFLRSLPRRLAGSGRHYPPAAAVRLGVYGACWLVLVGAIAAGVVIATGGILRPVTGLAGYAISAATVCLTIAGWLARPRRPPAGDRQHRRPEGPESPTSE